MVNEEYYTDWLDDNRSDLIIDFLEEVADQFDKYCKKVFKEEGGRSYDAWKWGN